MVVSESPQRRGRAIPHPPSGILLFLAVLLWAVASHCSAGDLAGQRRTYQEAERQLRAGNLTLFWKLAGQLEDYPLYPYLLHDYLRPRLWKVKEEEVRDFLSRYGDLPMAEDLRRGWLKLQAERRNWRSFLEFYTPQSDPVLACLQLKARMETGGDDLLLKDARSLWLSGKSRPPECDPVFALLKKSELYTPELVWERIGLAFEEGAVGLASYLARDLSTEDRAWVERWSATHHNPSKVLRNPGYADIPVARNILLHGMRRLARQSIDEAVARWSDLRDEYSFSDDERAEIDRVLAVRAAAKAHKLAKQLLDAVDNHRADADLLQWRLRTALADRDWATLLRWTEGDIPGAEALRGPWAYWRARALEATGDAEGARALYLLVAGERNYYGFMGADRAGIPYRMNHRPLPEDPEARKELEQRPAVRRAHELYLLGRSWPARREWHHALDRMTSYQMQIAAAIAAEWGWHDRVILTMAKAEAYDDLELRFPVPFQERLRDYAAKRGLDESWVYALVRAESAFMEDARSPAGALGLMQVMPNTGAEVAKRIGWRNFQADHLRRADVNVPIGTAYLKQMLERFQGNLILATAAYNAGPGAVQRWLPASDCVEPDIWIERIPFTETRKYVQRILYYSSIYDWRLRREVVPVRQRMAAVQALKPNLVAALTCSAEVVSSN
jgi:soluble lytic murein transglycosylase